MSGGGALDYVMVETWCAFPKTAIPETETDTTGPGYTALEVFKKVAATAV